MKTITNRNESINVNGTDYSGIYVNVYRIDKSEEQKFHFLEKCFLEVYEFEIDEELLALVLNSEEDLQIKMLDMSWSEFRDELFSGNKIAISEDLAIKIVS